MTSFSLRAEVELDASFEHAQLVDQAMLRISRNLLRYQQIEHGLKAVLPDSTSPESEDIRAEAENDKRRELLVSETLGNLQRRWAELVFRLTEGASNLDGDGIVPEERAERERRVIDDRNRLVHHLDRFRFAEADGCRALITELDDAFARAEEWHRCVHWLSMGTRLARLDAANGSPRLDALRLVESKACLSGERASSDASMQAQRDAIAALRRTCAGGWTPLSRVGETLYAEVPDIRPLIAEAGGLRVWIGAIAVFELRIHLLSDERTRAEVRLRPRASTDYQDGALDPSSSCRESRN